MKLQPNFPFCAVEAQQDFKLALILNAINPRIGGVLVSGPRGCAKSTLARGFVDILPPSDNAHQLITLPLGSSEEMLVGSLDLQQVLNEQKVAFNEGLLAKAHNGVLYVDEVNLLGDSLVDLLLDVSASGVNHIERDGISHSHQSEFILLGTMNPDEGELRPQLLDRFGFSVQLDNQFSVAQRMKIVSLREAFDQSPEVFCSSYADEQVAIQQRICSAIASLNSVQCSDALRELIAQRCADAHIDGLRGDIVWYRAAIAHAAWQGRSEVIEDDVLAVEELVLSHRRNQDSSNNTPPSSDNSSNQPPPFSRPDDSKSSGEQSSGNWGAMQAETQRVDASLNIGDLSIDKATKQLNRSGFNKMSESKRSVALSAVSEKASAADAATQSSKKIDWFKTFSHLSNINNIGDALRFKPKQKASSVVHLILLDTSASMLQQQQLAKAKACVLDIANNAYLQRQQICLIGFGNDEVKVLMNTRRAPKNLLRFLDDIGGAGGTPFTQMLDQAHQQQKKLLKQSPSTQFNNYVITDGRVILANSQVTCLQGNSLLIDIEQAAVKRGRGAKIAEYLQADYFQLPHINHA